MQCDHGVCFKKPEPDVLKIIGNFYFMDGESRESYFRWREVLSGLSAGRCLKNLRSSGMSCLLRCSAILERSISIVAKS